MEMVGYLLDDRMVETTERIDHWDHLVVTVPGNAWSAPKRDGWEHFFTGRHGDHTNFTYRRA